jgi:MFS family permease
MAWQYRHGVLGLCVLAYFGSRVGQVAIGPLIPEITAAFEVSRGAVGAALTGMWAAYALVQYPAGVFGDRFGERSVVLVSLAVAAAGAAALAAAPTFPLFVAVIFVLGVGVGLYYNVGTALLARQFDDLGRAIGIHRVGGQAAGLVAPAAATAVAVRWGWREGLLVGTVAALAALAGFWIGVAPTPPGRPSVRVRDRFDRGLAVDVLTRPPIAAGTAVAVLAEFAGMATTSFLPAFLVATRALSLTRAGLLFSAYFVVVGVAQPVTGWLSDRIGRDGATVLATLSGALGYGALLVPALPVLVGVVLAGYAMSWSAPVQAQFVERLGDDERGAGFGLVRTVYVLLGSLGSVVVGTAADVAGWRAAFGLLVGVMVTASAVVLASRLLGVSTPADG